MLRPFGTPVAVTVTLSTKSNGKAMTNLRGSRSLVTTVVKSSLRTFISAIQMRQGHLVKSQPLWSMARLEERYCEEHSAEAG